MPSAIPSTPRKEYDDVLLSIVEYVYQGPALSAKATTTARVALLDAIGCAFETLERSSECNRLIDPGVTGNDCSSKYGFKLPGTNLQLNPVQGAFCFGSMIRYLDHNDAFPGAEWGHPSDNLGAILAVADHIDRSQADQASTRNGTAMRDVLDALIKAYEIQGVFQIKNAFNKFGLDHTILVKVASTTVVSWLLGLTRDQALSALSHAWMDGHPLRTFRQFPNTGPRKGWAAGDACMRAVHLNNVAQSGMPGAPTVLTQPKWGFYDVLLNGQTFSLPQPFGSWVMENIVFKVNTAEGHALSAVEAALDLSKTMEERGLKPESDIAHVKVRTQDAGMVIINKSGPLDNPADRDHCMQYMVAVVLLKGAMIETEDYQNHSTWANDPRVDELREKFEMEEDKQFTANYHDPKVRSVSNGITITLKDGTSLPEAVVDYPLGHPKRDGTLAAVKEKVQRNLGMRLGTEKVDEIMQLAESDSFLETPVSEFVDLFFMK